MTELQRQLDRVLRGDSSRKDYFWTFWVRQSVTKCIEMAFRVGIGVERYIVMFLEGLLKFTPLGTFAVGFTHKRRKTCRASTTNLRIKSRLQFETINKQILTLTRLFQTTVCRYRAYCTS